MSEDRPRSLVLDWSASSVVAMAGELDWSVHDAFRVLRALYYRGDDAIDLAVYSYADWELLRSHLCDR